MVSQFKKRAWRRMVAGLFLLPALAEGGSALYAQSAPVAPPAMPAAASADAKTTCKGMVAKGRECLLAGDYAKAKQYAQIAQQMGVPKWEYYEDSPEKLLNDIALSTGGSTQAVTAIAATPLPQQPSAPMELPPLPAVGAPTAPAKPAMATGDPVAVAPPAAKPPILPTDPHQLLKMGREALKEGKLDLAKECGVKASVSNTRWGLFDDSPHHLLDDVVKARAERDRLESEKLLVDARTAFRKGEFAKAKELAHKSERLHGGSGSYSMWDLGDRPAKLLAEIQAAELRAGRSQSLPTTPKMDTTVAVKTSTPTTVATAAPTTPPPLPVVPPSAPKADVVPIVPVAVNSAPAPVAPVDVAMTLSRQTALKLLAECRALEQTDRLVEARAKAIEAQKLNAEFSIGEDCPDLALRDLSQKGVARISMFIQAAAKAAGEKPTPESAATAQAMLAQARQFAIGMGLDALGIDEKANALAQVGGGMMKPAPIATKADIMAQQGREMLAKAQIELRSGQTDAARRIAEAVYTGPFGLQNESLALIRNIEVEEQNQKVAAANKAYDAGMTAYVQGEHLVAMNVFLQIDQSLLTADKQAMIKQKMLEHDQRMAANKPKVTVPTQFVSADPPAIPDTIKTADYPGGPPPFPTPAPTPMPALTPAPGTARAGGGDQPQTPVVSPKLPMVPTETAPPVAQTLPPMAPPAGNPGGLANQVQALQEVEFQRLRTEGLKAQREAQSRFSKGETDAAIQILKEYLTGLKQANIDPTKMAMLQRPVEYRLQTFNVLKTQRDAEVMIANRGNEVRKDHSRKELEKDEKRKQVSELMKQFNQLYDEGKFEDAEVLAMKAHELDPESDAPVYAQNIAKIAKRQKAYEKIKNDKEQLVLDALNDTDKQGPYADIQEPLKYDSQRAQIAQGRKSFDSRLNTRMKTPVEKEIERKMSTLTTVEFNNLPLRTALQSMGGMNKVNIVPDLAALREKNISPDVPVSLKVEGISMKSALEIMLKQVGLTWNIEHDVLMITTEQGAKGKRFQKVYSVADLVIPIDNYALPNSYRLDKMLEKNVERSMRSPFANGGGLPVQPQGGLNGGTTVGALSTTPTTAGATTGASPMAASSMVTNNKNSIEDVLIKLIQNTVQPGTWSDVGGSGTIDYFPIGMALVINQTPDIQEQVADLLDALRRLQDMEVAVEVRIITVAETFFERIGMDFSVNLPGQNTVNLQNQITSGVYAPAGQLNSQRSTGSIVGVTPAGTLTSDLSIPIASTSFNYAIPPFGGYPNQPGNNGGLSLGVAFLNDIQVYMFMEAAQGDRRTNVMQAPKLTLFNGQTSTITISDTQFFVTDLNVYSINGQIVFSPINTPFPISANPNNPSISLAIQAVVSSDRRFVRLNLNPILGALSSATVPLFPVTVIVTPTFEGGFVGQPIPFTQFLQQPKFSTVDIRTTVMVPDGGTVLLGGLKSLSEGRNESGPPVLSKIPYINRLVKNTGYGREAQSMMIMVTPRIIINSEEEERQTGYTEPAAQ